MHRRMMECSGTRIQKSCAGTLGALASSKTLTLTGSEPFTRETPGKGFKVVQRNKPCDRTKMQSIRL